MLSTPVVSGFQCRRGWKRELVPRSGDPLLFLALFLVADHRRTRKHARTHPLDERIVGERKEEERGREKEGESESEREDRNEGG